MKFFSSRILGAIALSLGLTVSAHASELFSGIYSFGDSFSDMGNDSAAPVTTPGGQVWTYYFAQRFSANASPSNNGGSDYALSGDLTGSALPFSGVVDNGGMLAKTQSYLASHTVDSHALYTVWGGSSDINSQLPALLTHYISVYYAQYISEGYSPTEALALARIAATTTSGTLIVGHAISNLTTIMTALHNGGARYIMLFNLPDLGATPAGIASGLSTQLTALSQIFNTTLMAEANNMGFRVIQLDIYGLMREIYANPAQFGITPSLITTPCSGSGSSTCSGYLYWDQYYLTSTGYEATADYAYSVVTAPTVYAQLAQAPFSVMTAENNTVEEQINTMRGGLNSLAIGQFSVFGNANYTPTNVSSDSTTNPAYSGQDTNLTAGLVNRFKNNILTGWAFTHSHSTIDFGHHMGDYTADENMMTLFADYQFNHAYLDGMATGGYINYNEVDRDVNIGPSQQVAEGNTTAMHYGAALFGGYNIFDNNIKAGPVASLAYQDIQVKGYTETGADAADMQFQNQDNDSLLGSIGWKVSDLTQFANMPVMPFAQATYNHEFRNSDRDVEAGVWSSTLQAAPFSMEVNTVPSTNYEEISVGVGINPVKNINFTMSYAASLFRNNYHTQNMGLNMQVNL